VSTKHEEEIAMSELYEKISQLIISANMQEIETVVRKAIDDDYPAKEIIDKGLVPGMDVVGARMRSGDLFIPEVLRSAKTMQIAMDVIKPFLSSQDSAGIKKYVIGTVEGDQHDIGKNLVALMLEGVGFDVIDLGTGVTPQAFVDAVKEHQPKIIGMSALLTTTRPKMEETIIALKEAGLRDQVKVMCGGAPVTRKFVEEIGGDGYGANAAAAVDEAKELAS
jgi:corrinoid protein of di/trimethylamine methyltransferase